MLRRIEHRTKPALTASGVRGGPLRVALFSWALAMAACSTESVTVELEFMTLDYFLITQNAEILAFKNSGSTRCPELSMRARTRTLSEEPDASSGTYPVCELRNGGAGLELSPGEYDLLGVAMNRSGFVMVVGCTHASISEGSPDVSIPMAILSSDGRDALMAGVPTCPSVAARCNDQCD